MRGKVDIGPLSEISSKKRTRVGDTAGSDAFEPDLAAARRTIATAIAAGKFWLGPSRQRGCAMGRPCNCSFGTVPQAPDPARDAY